MRLKFILLPFILSFSHSVLADETLRDASLMVLGKDRLWYFDLQRKPFSGKAESFHENGKKGEGVS